MHFSSLKALVAAILALAFFAGCMEAHFDDGASSRILSNPSCSGLASLPAGYYCAYTSLIANPKLTGSGTAASPYEICSPYQLNAIGSDSTMFSSHIKLTADVDMSCITGNHTRIGSATAPFRGVFWGEGKTVSNWKYEDATIDNVGLFSYVQGASVYELTLASAKVTGKDYVGAAVGRAEASHLMQVLAGGTVTGVNYVGGVVGRSELGAVNQCGSSARVTGTNDVGGVAGNGDSPQVLSSYFTGTLLATGTNAGGVIGNASYGNVVNSYSTGTVSSSGAQVGGVAGLARGIVKNTYSTGVVSGTTSVGGIVGSLTSSGSLTNSFSISSVSGSGGSSLNVGVLTGTIAGSITNSYYWSGTTCDADSATGGTQACNTVATGSQASASSFQSSATQPLAVWDFQGESAVGTVDEWASVSLGYPVAWWVSPSNGGIPFFDGNGTTSSPYEISTTSQYNLISSNPRWMGSNFKLTANLNFATVTPKMIGSMHSPFFGSFDGNSKTISNAVITNVTQPYVGLFGVVLAPATISNLSIASSTITGASYTGGLVGLTTATISNVTFAGTLSVSSNSGGLVGAAYAPATITGGTVSAIITADVLATSVGGLVGYSNSNVTKSKSSSTLAGGSMSVGGLVGELSVGTISSSFTTGIFGDGFADQIGGLVGVLSNGAVLTTSYAATDVIGDDMTGGLVGKTNSGTTINACFSTGDVTGATATTLVGPLVGSHAGTATNSVDLATITCTPGAGSCNTSGVSSSAAAVTDFNSTSNAPLTSWNFTTIWQSSGAALPTHR